MPVVGQMHKKCIRNDVITSESQIAAPDLDRTVNGPAARRGVGGGGVGIRRYGAGFVVGLRRFIYVYVNPLLSTLYPSALPGRQEGRQGRQEGRQEGRQAARRAAGSYDTIPLHPCSPLVLKGLGRSWRPLLQPLDTLRQGIGARQGCEKAVKFGPHVGVFLAPAFCIGELMVRHKGLVPGRGRGRRIVTVSPERV